MTRDQRDVFAGSLALLGLFAGVRLATGFDGLYGQDPHEYLRHARALAAWLTGGAVPAPSFWPLGYPLAAAVLGFLLPQPLAAQCVSGAAWSIGFMAAACALRRLHPGAGRPGTGFLFVVFALSPLVARAAFLVMSDLLGVALLLVGLERTLAFRERGGRLRLGCAVAAFVAAATVRHATLLLAAPVLLWLVFRVRARRPELAAMLVGGLVPLLPAFALGDLSTLWPMQYPAAQAWSPANAWASRVASPDGWQEHAVPQALYALGALAHPKLLVCGPLLLPFLRRADIAGLQAALAAGFALHAAFLMGSPYQQDRHLLTGFAWVPLLLFPAWMRLSARLGPRLGHWLLLALSLLQLGLAGALARTPLLGYRLEQAAVACLRQQPPVGLYTFALTPALRSRGVPQDLHELWQGDVDGARVGDLVLYAPERFAAQWAGRPPATSFALLEARFWLREQATLPLGFRLYRLEPRP